MTFTYNASVDSSRNRLRLIISDTDSANYLFSDEELDLMLTLYGQDVHYSAAGCCRALAANKALQAVFYRLHDNDFEMDRRQVPKHFMELAKVYEQSASNMTVLEYFDSVDDNIGKYGTDDSEYVGGYFAEDE